MQLYQSAEAKPCHPYHKKMLLALPKVMLFMGLPQLGDSGMPT